MSIRRFRLLAGMATVLLPMFLGACAQTSTSTSTPAVIRVATHARLENLDPIATTAYITRTHGYLVYDTLFRMDDNYEPRPQMVDTWSISPDQKTWTFKLRDGLKWNDGTDVTAADCVASLERWSKRDGVGQHLFGDIQSLTAPDAKTIVMQLKAPDDSVLYALAKISSNVPFMMPKRIAGTDPFTPIQDPTGSGPYMLDKGASVSGVKTVYVKNPYYVARPSSSPMAEWLMYLKPDQIDLLYFADQADAAKALLDGKVDYFESPSTKLVPTLEADKNITVASTDPLGNVAMIRFNTLQPPFNNAEVRRAVLMAINQSNYMTAALGDHKWWRNCYSIFPCGTQYANTAGDQVMQTANIDAARRALKAAHYKGATVVVLNPTDVPVLSAFAQVTVDTLRKIGMTVQVRDMDWATLLKERNNRGPVADGGWSVFNTWWIAADVADPTAIAFSGNPDTGWVGWPKDQKLEQYRAQFAQARIPAERKVLAAKIQQRIYDIGALGVLGQFFEPVAFRKELSGIGSPVQYYPDLQRVLVQPYDWW